MPGNKVYNRQTNKNNKDQNKSNQKLEQPNNQKQLNQQSAVLEKNNTALQNMIQKNQTAQIDLNQTIQTEGELIKQREENFQKINNSYKPAIFDSLKLLGTEFSKQLTITQKMINGKKQLQKQSFLQYIWQKIYIFFEALKNLIFYKLNQICYKLDLKCHYFQQNLVQQDKSNKNSQNLFTSDNSNQDEINYIIQIKQMSDSQFSLKNSLQQLIKQFSSFAQLVLAHINEQKSQLIQSQQKIKELQAEIQNLNKENQKLQNQVEQLKKSNGQQQYTQNVSKSVQQNQNQDQKSNEFKPTKNNKQENLKINYRINSLQIPLKSAKRTQQKEDTSDISQIAMLLSTSDTGKKFIMKTLFPQLKQTKFYEKYNQKELDLSIVDTDCFEFEDIDERENQIRKFKQIFSDQRNQYQGIWIVVGFERIDIMKRNVMEIYKYVRGLRLPISMIVTNFHQSENEDDDQKQIIDKFEMFKLKKIVFFGNQTQKEEMINELKSTFYEFQRMKSVPIHTKDTIFEDEDPEFEKQLFRNLAQSMLRV